uniref:Orf252 n=1 Tax=Rhizophydium sp. 136 TaxID=60187 RepID=Q950N3_9FUNG|nr:orf252 [Rhizophydium sp. 136]AAK84275.1 orf252 [Rhizophydium sp. 136]
MMLIYYTKLKKYFGVGKVFIKSYRPIAVYKVTSLSELKNIIIPHFFNFPLKSKKFSDFFLWAKVVEKKFDHKLHLTEDGFKKILTYYASINKGIKPSVQKEYPNIVKINRVDPDLFTKLDPNWISGFVSGDGGFSINIRKEYVTIETRLHIAQHSKDVVLLNKIVEFFNCGKVYIRKNESTPRADYVSQNFNNNLNIIVKHFDSYPLYNVKQLDYLDFKEILNIINKDLHKTEDGFNRILELKNRMNKISRT